MSHPLNVYCEVCTQTKATPIFMKHGYQFVRCAGCGHVFVAAHIDNDALSRIYAEEFFRGRAYSDYVADEVLHRKNFARHVQLLRSLKPSGRCFEIGCAYGFFLDLARRYWDVEGVEINADAVAYARERFGLNVHLGDLLDLKTRQRAYDIVAMWDTIEHLREPAAYVRRVAEMLKPGGVLALTTGDVSSITARLQRRGWRLYYPPEHLHYFSRATISRLLTSFGFNILRIRNVGFHRSLDVMLFRLLYDRKPRAFRVMYSLAKSVGMTRLSVYLNLFDIMLVVAQKKEPG